MSFAKYGQHKPSGVDWLGSVPHHWVVMPIRLAARLESGHTPSRSKPEYWENCDIPWFTLGDVWQIRDGRMDRVFETKEKVSKLGLANSAARLLPKGTVILSRTASVGFAAIMGVDMATTQDFANWVCSRKLKPEFLLYVFRAMSGEFERLRMGSTHNTIYMPDISSMRFALPPLEDQVAIVRFLARETARIDDLVAEQQRLIELLKEKRQAVISHAVTKGLDPHAATKPSGIEWLGDVPGHWTVMPVRFAAKLESGHTPSRSSPEYWEDCNVPWVTLADVWQLREARSEYIFETKEKISELGLANSSARLLPKNTVVLSRTASVGFSAIMGADMATSQDFANWICDRHLQPHFLLYVFRAMHAEFGRLMMGSTHNTIYMPDIRSLHFALPPMEEQRAIVGHVQEQARSFDELIDDAERGIALLRERRTALISAAVTGKIDARSYDLIDAGSHKKAAKVGCA